MDSSDSRQAEVSFWVCCLWELMEPWANTYFRDLNPQMVWDWGRPKRIFRSHSCVSQKSELWPLVMSKHWHFFPVKARCQGRALQKSVCLFITQWVLKSVCSAGVWLSLEKMPLILQLLIAGSPTLSCLKPQLMIMLWFFLVSSSYRPDFLQIK